MTAVCPECDEDTDVEREFTGSYAALIVLLILGLGPGLIYYVIRRERVCQRCGALV